MKLDRKLLIGGILMGVIASACGTSTNDPAATTEPQSTSEATSPDAEGDGMPWDGFEGRELNVVSWGGSWTEEAEANWYGPFSEETGVKVNFIISGSDPTSTVMLQIEQNAIQIDLVDGATASRLEYEDMLEPLPADLKAALEETSREGTVTDNYLEFGTTASLIVCNPDLVDRCPTNVDEFWDVENFPGDRGMSTHYALTLGFAGLAAGADPANLLPLDLEAAVEKLEEIRPHIKVWPDSGAMLEQVMIDREVAIQYMWNGRAFHVKTTALPQLEMYWDDSVVSSGAGWAVPKGAPNADVAMAFLHWIGQHPENQAAWTQAMTYPTPTKQLLDLVTPEVAESLPSAHNPAVMDAVLQVQQADEMQRAWQAFMTGT